MAFCVEAHGMFVSRRKQSLDLSIKLKPPWSRKSRATRTLHNKGFALLGLVKDVGKMALATHLAIVHSSHEHASAAFFGWALPPQPLNLPVSINLVVLEHGQLDLLALVLDLLGCGVDLLLALLSTAAKSEDKVQSGLLLDVVVGKGATIFQLLAGEDQTLLIGGNSFLVCRRG